MPNPFGFIGCWTQGFIYWVFLWEWGL